MNLWVESLDDWDYSEPFDPLCVERSAPIDDEEAARIEALCRAATPGPMTLDDQAATEGSVVAILPDGRAIATLTPCHGEEDAASTADANAQLICKARYLLLRLLRDRECWKKERERLLERIRSLEEALHAQTLAAGARRPTSPRRAR
jgi:hypothetical protein